MDNTSIEKIKIEKVHTLDGVKVKFAAVCEKCGSEIGREVFDYSYCPYCGRHIRWNHNG
jgi:predicted RNA-binding Zn-ribbon protein involved in translation (DUF1610 family)